MDSDVLTAFADQLGVDPEVVSERWEGRPDLLMEDIFRVRDADTGEIRDLELFDTQRKAVHAYFYGDADTVVNYKGRRIGYSFIYMLNFLVEGIFIPQSFYPVVSRKYEQAENRIGDLHELIKHAKVTIPTNVSNNGEIELWNGSAFKAYSGNADASRGDKSARGVLLDEAAFIEEQKKVSRAFGAFLALGKNRKMVMVSTPNVANDLFMTTFERGTPSGYDDDGNRLGVIAIKQPSFWNADEIDIHKSLLEQDVKPVRPDMNIARIEVERASDPEGFGQEYLCRPIIDEYRFFSASSIERAMERGAEVVTGLLAPKSTDFRAMGVDIGISHDDTVIQVFDHIGDRRIHRYLEVLTNESLEAFGFENPDRGNARQVAEYLAHIQRNMDIDLVVLDRTGPGETFDRQITEKLGSRVLGFNFSDVKKFEEMMGDMNSALRNDKVTLIPDDRFKDELQSVMKIKKEDWSTPRFSGKDNSKSGKDDTAMAAVLAAFPPGYVVKNASGAAQRDPSVDSSHEFGDPWNAPEKVPVAQREEAKQNSLAFGSTAVSRHRGSRTYTSRYQRGR